MGEDKWVNLELDRVYRPRGMKYSPHESPLLLAIPKAYIYDCELCGNEFRIEREIHIPWCKECREKNINELINNKGVRIFGYSTKRHLSGSCP